MRCWQQASGVLISKCIFTVFNQILLVKYLKSSICRPVCNQALVCLKHVSQKKPPSLRLSPCLRRRTFLASAPASCCSVPAGTDRPPLSACLQISYRDLIALAAWLNAHLLARLRLRVCVCVCWLLPSPHSWNGVSLFICCPAITDTKRERERDWLLSFFPSSNKQIAKQTSWTEGKN